MIKLSPAVCVALLSLSCATSAANAPKDAGPDAGACPQEIVFVDLAGNPLATFDFDAHKVGASSKVAAFVLRHEGPRAWGVLTTRLEGAASADYSIVEDGCAGKTLGAAAQCEVKVRFSPRETGLRLGALTISAGAGDCFPGANVWMNGRGSN